MSDQSRVCIIGAGLAGLSCARHLQERGIENVVLESSDGVGGRVRTDVLEGFLLDRGFQALHTAYPEIGSMLDLEALKLHPFSPSVLIRFQGDFHRLGDPSRSARNIISAVTSRLLTSKDKMLMASHRKNLMKSSLAEIFQRPEKTTLQHLNDLGFSETIIERFFRPFFSGLFFEQQLSTSSRMSEFFFREFLEGELCLPSRGIEAIPRQLARPLAQGTIRKGEKVEKIQPGKVISTGGSIKAEAAIVATDAQEAARLLGREDQTPGYRSSFCMYFQAENAPLSRPILVLNGENRGPIANLCLPSQVAPSYAPSGLSLICVTGAGTSVQSKDELLDQVRNQCADWFGKEAQSWSHLRTYHFPRAVPVLDPPTADPHNQEVRMGNGLYVCGEYGSVSSYQWAMFSGKKAAQAVAEDLA